MLVCIYKPCGMLPGTVFEMTILLYNHARIPGTVAELEYETEGVRHRYHLPGTWYRFISVAAVLPRTSQGFPGHCS